VFWMLWASVRRNHAVGAAALGVLIGGALGNFVDRLLFGYVFDWILLVGRSALNVADLCILLGALVYAGTATRLESSTAVPAD
jgi:signal peptidase II